MENNHFQISSQIVWISGIVNLLSFITIAIIKILVWDISQALLISGIILLLSTWVIILIDISKNKLYNKTFWLMSMFVLATLAPVVYAIRREKLMRFADRKVI